VSSSVRGQTKAVAGRLSRCGCSGRASRQNVSYWPRRTNELTICSVHFEVYGRLGTNARRMFSFFFASWRYRFCVVVAFFIPNTNDCGSLAFQIRRPVCPCPITPAVMLMLAAAALSLFLFHSSIHYHHQACIIIQHSFFKHSFFKRLRHIGHWTFFSWVDHTFHLRLLFSYCSFVIRRKQTGDAFSDYETIFAQKAPCMHHPPAAYGPTPQTWNYQCPRTALAVISSSEPIYQKRARRKKNEREHYRHNHHVGDRSRTNGT
jgi:hypothetical protein